MNQSGWKDFTEKQASVVSEYGAFVSLIRNFIDFLNDEPSEDILETRIRQLLPTIGEFLSHESDHLRFFQGVHYDRYYTTSYPGIRSIANLLSDQTLPSKRMSCSDLASQTRRSLVIVSEVMLATAKIVPSRVDLNLKAENPFSAYCFISYLVSTSDKLLVVVDPYLDESIFYRYLWRLPRHVNIKIVSDSSKLSGNRLKALESVEILFSSEYQNYTRKLVPNLHDRFIVNEAFAFSLGGSLKDAAKKADYTITQLEDSRRLELLKLYA